MSDRTSESHRNETEASSTSGRINFEAISRQFQSSISALREFFAALNPVAAGLDTTAQGRDEAKRAEIMEAFGRRANAADRDQVGEFAELLTASLKERGEKSIEFTSELAGQTVVQLLNTFRIYRSASHHELLCRSILTSLVGFYEVLISDLIHAFYALIPQAASTDDKVLSVNELRSFDTIQDAMDFVVSRRADTILRGGLEDFKDFFKTKLKIDIEELVPEWQQWSEMFQRRHLMVHAGGRVTRRYLEKVNWNEVKWPPSRPTVGAGLELEDDYLELALDLFEIAGILLCHDVWSKLVPNDTEKMHGDAEDGLIGVVYGRLLMSQWYVTEHLARWGSLDSSAPEDTRLIHRFNHWLSVKRQGRYDEIASELEHFDASAKHPRFVMALASLRDRPDDFFAALPSAIAGGVTRDELSRWPILEEMRKDPRFEQFLPEGEAPADLDTRPVDRSGDGSKDA